MNCNFGLYILFFVVTFDVVLGGQFQGCYKENLRRRYFRRNPGDFDPGALTPTICAAKCGSFSFPYAAIAEGRFCFCGDALPDISSKDVSNTLCTKKCSGDSSINCGSKSHVSVYSAAPPILGLTLTSNAGGVVEVHNVVTFSASVSSGGADLAFKMDYDDGAGKTDKNATGLWQRNYHVPGHYKVSLFGNDNMDSLVEKEATTTVMVDAPVKTSTLNCPDYMATHEEDYCTLSILEGTNMELKLYLDTVLQSTFTIADPLIFTTGPAIPTKGGTALLSGETASIIIMPASQFMYKSVIISFEAYAEVAGSIEILVLSPTCGGSTPYCFDTNDCSVSCNGVHEKTCTSKEFCPSAMNCWTSGSSTCDILPTRYDGTQRTDLTIVKTITRTITTGHTYIPIDVSTDYIEVDHGYILGYKPVVGKLHAVTSTTSDTDLQTTNVATKGSATAPAQNKRHILRAVTSVASAVYIPVKFTSPGVKDISITVANLRITGSESNATQISVIEGIDMAIINVPQYIEKDLPITFQLLDHTGTNITYGWDFDDGTVINTTDTTYSYTYSNLGQYNVSVTAFNPLSSKSNITTIYVQDRIRNFVLVDSVAVVDETTTIPVSMTTGSDYICTWRKDGVLIATTDETTTPPGGTFDHIFTAEGSFVIAVICKNNINTVTTSATYTTQYRIANLQLVKTGALINQDYTINWTWTAGTNPNFILEYDSQVKAFTKDPYFNTAISQTFAAVSSLTQYPLNLTAYNLVSNEQIIINFGIEQGITDIAITSSVDPIDPNLGYAIIGLGQSVNFTVNATGGTNVKIEWDYGDGTNDSESLSTWSSVPPHSRTHPYNSLGWFNAVVKIHNLYNSHTEVFKLLAISPVQNLAMSVSPSQVLFLPPATVGISFTNNSTDPAPNEAMMYIDYGNGESDTVAFDVAKTYTYEYREMDSSPYTITANISNVISWQLLSTVSVQVIEKIEGIEITTNPEHAALGDPITINVKIRRADTGSLITLDWDLQDGQSYPSTNRIGVSPDGIDTKVTTYYTVKANTITVTVHSPLEDVYATKSIECQHKVTSDLQIASSHPKNIADGGVIDYTFHYSGTPQPTAATIAVNYGDGTETTLDSTWLTTGSGSDHTLSHTYATDGDYITTFTLTNLVSTEIFEVSSGVYTLFVGLSVQPKYKPSIPITGPDQDGFGPNKDIFQLDRPVKFYITKTSGTFVYYSVMATNGLMVILCNKTTEDVFEMEFNVTGTYNIQITANNPISTQSVSTTIKIMKAVRDVAVKGIGKPTTENQPKVFDITFEEAGTSTCVNIDYGDGSAEMYGDSATCSGSQYSGSSSYKATFTGNNFQVNHTYSSMNTYEVRITAFNEYSTSNTFLSHVVSTVDCSKPTIDIKYKTVVFWEPTKIERKSPVHVIGSTTINCGSSLENIKQWTVESVDPDYGTESSSIDISTISSRFNAELDLPAFFLNVGLYKVSYVLEMKADAFTNNETFKSAAYTYIRVIPSTLVGNIFPGGMTKIQRGINRMLKIDPESNTYDPDVPAGSPQTFVNFTWFCREIEETWPTIDAVSSPYTTTELPSVSVDNGGCFKQGPGRIDITLGSLTFDTGNMKVNKTYEFKVHVFKAGHDTVEMAANVTIVDGVPPEISIRCSSEKLCLPSPDGLVISPSVRLGLLGDCSFGCDDNTVYEWKIYTADYQWTWKNVNELASYSDGINSINVAIHDALFKKYPNVTKYQVSVTATTSSGVTGTAYTTFIINVPPSGGTCSITPNIGTVLQTKFDIKCSNWSDSNGITEYQTYCVFKDDTVLKQISFGLEDWYSGNMPLGPDYDNYNMNCFTRIKDKFGAFSVASLGTVQVNPVPIENVTDMLNQMKADITDSFDKIAAEGNVNQINNLALAYSTLISMASQNDSIEYDGIDIAARETSTGIGPDYTDRTSAFYTTTMDPEVVKQKKAEYEEKRNTRAEFTSQIIGALENCTIATTSAIALTGSTMAELTQYTENCARSCQEKSSGLAISMIDKLDELSETSSKEDILEASRGILSTLANVQEAGDIHKKQPTTGDKEEVEPFAIYDTDLESNKKGMSYDIHDLKDGKDLLLQQTNEGFQEQTSAKVDASMKKILKIIRHVLHETLVPGEQVVISTPKMIIQIEKNNAGQVANKTLEMGTAKIDLPNWCDMEPYPCDKSKTVMIQSSYTTYAPHRDSDQTSQISKYSGSISLDFFDDSGNTIAIRNAASPIELQIPLDRLMAKPTSEHIVPYIPDRDWEYFYYHTAYIELNRGSLHIQIDMDDTSQQFLVVLRLGSFPNITSREFDFSCLIGPTRGAASVADGSKPNTCFVSSDDINGFQGKVYIGVREVQPYEHERYRTNDLVPTSFSKGGNFFTTNYSITTTSASCPYYSEINKKWQTDGCNVGPSTNPSYVQCFCTHLTTFAGGWVVAPNAIDWNFVFSNADFLKNPTLYTTMIVISVLYFVTVIWARRQDKKDIEKLGLTPLADNEKKDTYFYEIVVVTGMRRRAGTDSKVQFILAGEDDETDVRTLSDSKRKILRRGTVDGFLMSSPRPLGALNYLHIWHDNSGKGPFASWYLRSVVVRDVQTDEKFIFICNRWFAVEEDDGQVDRVIPVAGKEQMTEFSHLFTEKTAKSLSDGHLWFSVVARPPQSRFTRVQRVSCCLCLLYLSMLTNAMFYEKDEGTNVYTFGPFALSPEQIYIGVISNIIVFPVTFLIITLFRKSRPKTKRPSRVQTALNNTTKRATSMTDVNPTLENTREGTLTPSVLLEQKNRPDTSLSRGYTSLSVGELVNKTEGKKKKKKMDFPWYFVIFGWILLWIATLVSAAFVLFYGIQFQDVKCKKWITSMLVSFLASIFVTQPIKVFLTAIIFSLIVKNPGSDDEDEEEDEEKPRISTDEQLLHEDSLYSIPRPKRAAYAPPDPVLMEKARQVRMNEIKMWSVIREILFYSFFLWILMVISYRNRSQLMYTYKNSMEQVFIVTNNTNHSFMKTKNQDDFWSWAKSGMGNGLRALNYYNNEQPLFLRGYINDKQSRIMGYATMRQLRVTAGSCIVPDAVLGIIHECNDEYSISNEDKKSYDIGWGPLSGNITKEEYGYTSSSELDGYPYWGEISVYGGGGYVVRLRGNVSVLRDKMSELEQEGWIDRYTRAVFVEFTVYNPGVNLFAVSTMLAEFRPSQGIVPSYRFEPVMLFPYMNSVMLFVLGCEITYMLFTLYFIFAESRNLYKLRLAYFKEFWNFVELGICGMSVTAVVIYFYRMLETNRLTDVFKDSHGNEYMKFQYVGYWSEIFSYIIGWLVFFATLKFLKLLRFNKKICLLASTMKASARDLIHFSIIFNIVFLAFIQLFYMIYVANIKSFKTFVTSCESGIVMMMGKFDIYEMSAAQPVLTQIFLFLYVLVITFIVVNMFLSILNETFTTVRMDTIKQNNDYEIVQFMMSRLKLWTGLGTPDKSVLKPTSVKSVDKRGPTELFPDQIDRLLNSISHIYMEKERLDELFDKNAYARAKGADLPMYNPPSVRSLKYERMTLVQT